MKIFIACFLASLGFAFIFNIPENKALYAGMTGGIGGIVYSLCLNLNLSETLALF
ncbi:MAG: threonine/serine exporter family protein, partial [Erysipelotrichaceae bacterium]